MIRVVRVEYFADSIVPMNEGEEREARAVIDQKYLYLD